MIEGYDDLKKVVETSISNSIWVAKVFGNSTSNPIEIVGGEAECYLLLYECY